MSKLQEMGAEAAADEWFRLERLDLEHEIANSKTLHYGMRETGAVSMSVFPGDYAEEAWLDRCRAERRRLLRRAAGSAQEAIMDTYKPNPINTADVVLEKDLRALGETLAEHLHDIWSLNKIGHGYSYGPVTNDGKDGSAKTHKDLVPYDALPDEIQKYDRDSGMGAIKAIKALGWTLVPPDAKR